MKKGLHSEKLEQVEDLFLNLLLAHCLDLGRALAYPCLIEDSGDFHSGTEKNRIWELSVFYFPTKFLS